MYCNVVQHKLLVQVRNIQILLLLTAQQEKNTPRQKSGEYNVWMQSGLVTLLQVCTDITLPVYKKNKSANASYIL